MPSSINVATHVINNVGAILLWLVLLVMATREALFAKKANTKILV